MTREERLAEVVFAPIGASLLAPDTQVIARDGWYQLLTPSSKSARGNEVIWSRVPAIDAERVVIETLTQYTALALPFKWCTSPLTEPASFGTILERHGFVGWPTRGMAIEPTSFTVPTPSDVTVEPISDATLDEYLATMSAGWGGDLIGPSASGWRADLARSRATGRYHLFLARHASDGCAVGTAGFIVKPRSGYLVGGNVLPAYRGRGVYRALLAERLRRIAALGLPLATTQAREETSAPILARLGFESLYTAPIYRSPHDN